MRDVNAEPAEREASVRQQRPADNDEFIKKNDCSLQPPFVEVIWIGLASRHLTEQTYETF